MAKAKAVPKKKSYEDGEFDDSPQSQQRRWAAEFEAAEKDTKKWRKRGARIVKRFRDERDDKDAEARRWNVFSSNIQTITAILYGQVPQTDVGRRFDDAADDVARVAGLIAERALNADIQTPEDGFAAALAHVLQDRLLPGLGVCRIRYEVDEEEVPEVPAALHPETGEELAPAVPATTQVTREDVRTDYVQWGDFRWSPARTWQEVRWVAFACDMSRRELVEAFGQEVADAVPLNAKRTGEADATEKDDGKKRTPWARAQVWEVWSKEDEKVYWYVDGARGVLRIEEDPLGLPGFFPCPRPLIANPTTDTLVPVPDFALAQDLYDEVDDLTTRIQLLQKAIQVRGVYDKTAEGVQRLLQESAYGRNELIPIDGWAAFLEKGGLQGVIAWLPLEMLVAALDKLREVRQETLQAIYQVTGMSDILRGQASEGDVTATEQRIKARFGSARMRALQQDFARLASETQQLKLWVMCSHFQPETLLERSNIAATPDAALAQQAVALLQSKAGMWRVQVKPETVAMEDLGEKRTEATDFVTALSTFLTSAAPLATAAPGSTPALLQLLGVVLTRFKFADEVEGIIDGAVAQAKAAQQQPAMPQPDPKVVAAQATAQAKGAVDMQKAQLDHQLEMQKLAAEVQAEQAKQAAQTQQNLREEAGRALIKVQAARSMPQPMPRGAP